MKTASQLGVDLELCRELLIKDSPDLNKYFRPQNVEDLEDRISLGQNGIFNLALDIVRKDSPHHGTAIVNVWTMFNNSLPIQDVDNEDENKPIEMFVTSGGIPLMARQLERDLKNGDFEPRVFLTFAWCATVDTATPEIVKAGVHKVAIAAIRKGPERNDMFDTAMSFTRAASACHTTRAQLRADGALDAVIPHLDGLKTKGNDLALRRGFRAGSIVARLAGNDETGIGPQILQGNPALIAKTLEVFDRVLDAGPKGAVMNMYINPHFITMDLLLISVSDANKKLLKSAVPILIKALRLRGATNEQMTVDIVKTLLQLTYDDECMKVMRANSAELLQLLRTIIVPPKYDIEALMSGNNLINMLDPQQTPTSASAPAPKNRLGALARMVIKETKTDDGKVRRRSSFSGTQKHVMLSYNWGSKDIVRQVDSLLRINGVKTWFDERDMGPDLTESMAQAVQGAAVVFVFMTAKYKESANCRKECEYADSYKIPITYIMTEENYKPDGWLGFQLGKMLWVACWSLDLVNDAIPALMQRVKLASSASAVQLATDPALPLPPAPLASSSTSVSSGGVASKEIVEMLKALKLQIDELKASLEDTKTNQIALIATVDEIKADIKELKAKPT